MDLQQLSDDDGLQTPMNENIQPYQFEPTVENSATEARSGEDSDTDSSGDETDEDSVPGEQGPNQGGRLGNLAW